MNVRIVVLSLLAFIVSVTSGNDSKAAPEDMNKKIQQIAKNIVDKWIDEGLTVTRDKVEGWINIVDEAQAKAKAEKQRKQPQKVASKVPKPPLTDGLDGDFNQVKDTLVKTFTKIGQVPCTDCKKTIPVKKTAPEDERLEGLSLEELKEKQELIKAFGQMGKMAKLAKMASNFQNIGKLNNLANVALEDELGATKHEEL